MSNPSEHQSLLSDARAIIKMHQAALEKIEELEIVNNRALSSGPYQKITALHTIIDEMRKALLLIEEDNTDEKAQMKRSWGMSDFITQTLASVDKKLKELV